jgi:hypothetical protein
VFTFYRLFNFCSHDDILTECLENVEASTSHYLMGLNVLFTFYHLFNFCPRDDILTECFHSQFLKQKKSCISFAWPSIDVIDQSLTLFLEMGVFVR